MSTDSDDLDRPVIPAERRIVDDGWQAFLHRWDREKMLLLKQTFLRWGLAFLELEGYINKVVEFPLQLELKKNVLVDALHYPGCDDQEQAEGERRLREFRNRLRLLRSLLPDLLFGFDHLAILEDTLGFSSATETAIQAAETRLGIRFPPSYRSFLKHTNGWLVPIDLAIWPVERVAFLREIDEKLVKEWQGEETLYGCTEYVVTPEPLGEGEPFVYCSLEISPSCLDKVVVLGVGYQKDYLLLDPTCMDEYGEWRSLYIQHVDTVTVGRDFARMMEILYRFNTVR